MQYLRARTHISECKNATMFRNTDLNPNDMIDCVIDKLTVVGVMKSILKQDELVYLMRYFVASMSQIIKSFTALG